MMHRILPLAIAVAMAACAKSGDDRGVPADSGSAAAPQPTTGAAAPADTGAGQSPAPAESMGAEGTGAESTTAPSTPARERGTASPESTRPPASPGDSGTRPRPRLPKGAVTDTGYRPPRDTITPKLPERRPMYPPFDRRDTTSRDSGAADSGRVNR